MLKKLGTEASLLSAIGPSLKKSTEERGPFDNMAIQGVEEIFKSHLGSLQEQIDKADVLKAEKVASKDVLQAALDTTLAKRTTSEGALKEAEGEVTVLETRNKDLYEAAARTSGVADEALAQHAITEGCLAKAKEVLSGFTELLERQIPFQFPFDEVMSKAEEIPEAFQAPCHMESVAAQ